MRFLWGAWKACGKSRDTPGNNPQKARDRPRTAPRPDSYSFLKSSFSLIIKCSFSTLLLKIRNFWILDNSSESRRVAAEDAGGARIGGRAEAYITCLDPGPNSTFFSWRKLYKLIQIVMIFFWNSRSKYFRVLQTRLGDPARGKGQVGPLPAGHLPLLWLFYVDTFDGKF